MSRYGLPRPMAGIAVLALALALAAPAGAFTVDLDVRVGNAPPPPAFVFEDEPEVILVPSSRVYYVPGMEFDLYRYGRNWYINQGGWWYRASTYRGPFLAIEYDRVPGPILRVPPKFHRHPLGGPPGQTGIHPVRGANLDKQEKGKGKWKWR